MTRTLLAAALATTFATLASPAEAAAPDEFKVKFETTAGDFTIAIKRRLAPQGVDRFHELVTSGFYDEARFFRVVPRFVVQFGITGDPKVQAKWREKSIKDDKVQGTNKKGTITFAKTNAPNSRTTQIFINLGDNAFLDRMGFAPFGEVVEGMENVEKITAKYGEKPDQGRAQAMGNEYFKSRFPDLDYIKKASVVKDDE